MNCVICVLLINHDRMKITKRMIQQNCKTNAIEAVFHNSLIKSAEMAKLWKFASNADSFDLRDIEDALSEIQVV